MDAHEQNPFREQAREAVNRVEEQYARLPEGVRSHIDRAALEKALTESRQSGGQPRIGDEVIEADSMDAGTLRKTFSYEVPRIDEEEVFDLGFVRVVSLELNFDTMTAGVIDTPFGPKEVDYDRLVRISIADGKRLEIAAMDTADAGPILLRVPTPDPAMLQEIVLPKHRPEGFSIEVPELVRLVNASRRYGKGADPIPDATEAWRFRNFDGQGLYEPVSQEFTKNPPVFHAVRSPRILVTGSGRSLAGFEAELRAGKGDRFELPEQLLNQVRTAEALQRNSHVDSFWSSFFDQGRFLDGAVTIPRVLIDTGEMRSNDYMGGSTLRGAWLGERLQGVCENWGVQYFRVA